MLQVELHMKDQPLKSVFNEIQRQTDYTFVYNNSLVDVNRKVSIDVKADLKEVLHQLLSGLKLSFQIIGEQIIISPSSFKIQTSTEEREKLGKRSRIYVSRRFILYRCGDSVRKLLRQQSPLMSMDVLKSRKQ